MGKIELAVISPKTLIRRNIKIILRDWYQLTDVKFYRSPLSLLKQKIRKPNTIIFDMNGGNHNSFMLHKIKKKYPKIQIIVITDESNTAELFEAISAGARGYLFHGNYQNYILTYLDHLGASTTRF